MHVSDSVADNFVILVDSMGVAGSEIDLHVRPSRFRSLAENGFYDVGTQGWRPFAMDGGSYLQEVAPDGDIVFRVTPGGAAPAVWKQALCLDTAGQVRPTTLVVPTGTRAPNAGNCVAGTAGAVSFQADTDVFHVCDGST